MVGSNLLGSSLIQLIESVSNSSTDSEASQVLLRSILDIFQVDQAALFEKNENGFQCLLALDRTGKILRGSEEIFASHTIIERALLTMEPLNLRIQKPDALTPQSVKNDSLKQIICLPLSRAPGTAIFMGSRSFAQREFSEDEMQQFKTAARAAWLAIRQFKTQDSLSKTQGELKAIRQSQTSLIFAGAPISTLLAEAERVAAFNVALLLQGESGSGKEELARFIHQKSGRKGAFVAVNCANLSETLLESELFGYRKGAFTGASQNRDGLFKAADGGTLFLDEIAEIPVNLQAKLLRALQEKSIRPVGSNEDIEVDVRLVSATHQDLETRISRGEFRADLFYRIQEFTLMIPALRQRVGDIEVLTEHFLAQASREMNLPRKRLSGEALQKLVSYNWPGNVRELKNTCRTALILSRDFELKPEDFRISPKAVSPTTILSEKHAVGQEPQSDSKPLTDSALSSNESPLATFIRDATAPTPGGLKTLSKQFEREVVRQLIMQGKSQGEAAAYLGVSVRTLQRILSGDQDGEFNSSQNAVFDQQRDL